MEGWLLFGSGILFHANGDSPRIIIIAGNRLNRKVFFAVRQKVAERKSAVRTQPDRLARNCDLSVRHGATVYNQLRRHLKEKVLSFLCDHLDRSGTRAGKHTASRGRHELFKEFLFLDLEFLRRYAGSETAGKSVNLLKINGHPLLVNNIRRPVAGGLDHIASGYEIKIALR